MLRDRPKMIQRLNAYGTFHFETGRVGNRKYVTHPLVVGDLVCRRDDCVYRQESLYTLNQRRNRSVKERCDPEGSRVHVVPEMNRYRTSRAAVEIAINQLVSAGIRLFGPGVLNNISTNMNNNNDGSCIVNTATTIVADICGSNADMVAWCFSQPPYEKEVRVVTNDANPRVAAGGAATTCLDASATDFPQQFVKEAGLVGRGIDVVMTSPPFAGALPIVINALALAKKLVVLKLPLNFLCAGPQMTDRRDFLRAHPPTSIIPLNRSDNGEFYSLGIDEAWFVWLIGSEINNDGTKPSVTMLPAFIIK